MADSKAIKKGEIAPFDGVLIDNATANKLNNDSLELDKQLKINEYQNKITDIDAEKIKILSTQNDKLATQLQSSRQFENWERILYITLGIAAATVGAIALDKLK